MRWIWSDLGFKQRVNIGTFREAQRYSRSEGRALNVSSISGSIYIAKVMGLATWNGTDVAQTQFIPCPVINDFRRRGRLRVAHILSSDVRLHQNRAGKAKMQSI